MSVTDWVVLADVWERRRASRRAPITGTALARNGSTEQLGDRLARALGKGLTKAELKRPWFTRPSTPGGLGAAGERRRQERPARWVLREHLTEEATSDA
jgi:hypothetical protein